MHSRIRYIRTRLAKPVINETIAILLAGSVTAALLAAGQLSYRTTSQPAADAR
ncbi:MAG: hypothetical protein J2P28_08540 [Actinobacteria bacterium]|nr:hypothetical protein [Actinomycetota bacterium]